MNDDLARQIIELLTSIRDSLNGGAGPAPAPVPVQPQPRPSPKMTAKATPPTDDEWLDKLSADPVYAGVDVKREFGKARHWADTNKKQVTRRFFINWLNRVERPVQVQGLKQVQPGTPPVYTKPTPSMPQGVPPPPEVAEKLSRLLGGNFMKSMGGSR